MNAEANTNDVKSISHNSDYSAVSLTQRKNMSLTLFLWIYKENLGWVGEK